MRCNHHPHRDFDIVPERTDSRWFEVVAEGFGPVWRVPVGAARHVGITVVRGQHPPKRAHVEDRVALREARKRTERAHPKLCQGNGRTRLVIVAGEVVSSWSRRNQVFVFVMFGMRESIVRVATDVRQCPRCLVQVVDVRPRLFGENSGWFLLCKELSLGAGGPGAIRQRGVG